MILRLRDTLVIITERNDPYELYELYHELWLTIVLLFHNIC